MAEEKIVSATDGAEMDAGSYIEALNQLKQTTVSKDSYEKLKAENKQLLNSLVNGSAETAVEAHVDEPSVADLKDHLNSEGIGNLDYIQTALKLREKVLKEEGRDLFCPVGIQYSPTQEDVNCAQKVAEQLQQMVDDCEGSPEVFNALYQRSVRDVVIPRK